MCWKTSGTWKIFILVINLSVHTTGKFLDTGHFCRCKSLGSRPIGELGNKSSQPIGELCKKSSWPIGELGKAFKGLKSGQSQSGAAIAKKKVI